MNNHYAVIGNPVLHSLSPLIHQRAFDYYKINARYFAYEVHDFSLFMEYFHTGKYHETFQAYSYLDKETKLYNQQKKLVPYTTQDFDFPMQGLSITIPYKKDVLQIANNITYRAELSGAANTLYWHDNQLIAENTDIQGFLVPIQEEIQKGKKYQSALIYGAGGAACAVLVGLLHCSDIEQIYICARREEQAQELIAHIKKQQELLEQYTLNTQAKLTYIPLEHKEFPCDIVINTIIEINTIFQDIFFKSSILFPTEIPAKANNGVVIERKLTFPTYSINFAEIGFCGMLRTKPKIVTQPKAGNTDFGNISLITKATRATNIIKIIPGTVSIIGVPNPTLCVIITNIPDIINNKVFFFILSIFIVILFLSLSFS